MAFDKFDFAPNENEAWTSIPLRLRRRLEQALSPLTHDNDIEYGRASVVSTGGSEYYTATPNTPNNVQFPRDACTFPEPAALHEGLLDGRTPQTSFSSTTAVEPLDGAPGKSQRERKSGNAGAEGLDLDAVGSVPIPLRGWFWISLIFFMVAGGTALECLCVIGKQGWSVGAHFTEQAGIWHILLTSPPIVFSMLMSCLWGWTRTEVQRLQPFINLAGHRGSGNNAGKTILLDYTRMNMFTTFLTSIRKGDKLVAYACLASILTFTFQPLFAALLTVRAVYWLYPAINSTSLSEVGLNAPANFMDMTAFQGASGFATAKVLYDIGPAPFVDDVNGYTVEAFDLPTDINGTVYANVTAVHNQAFCLVMGPNNGTSDFSGTAWFDGCHFSLVVDDAVTDLFGVAPLPDLSECQNSTNVSLQFRPVLFWFFIPQPQPTLSIVLCTPSIAVASASVAVDLASNTTSVLSATDITSTVASSRAIYNGLFFDDQSLDQTARARLEGIQQQLPSAVFQAAKAQDPNLVDAFEHRGFANITAKIYNTYLSLVAKNVYFVDVQKPITVRVGAYCPRVFLVPWVVHALVGCMGAVFVSGLLLYTNHPEARRDLLLPSRLGTLATALWITADPEVRFTLDEVPWNGSDRAIDKSLEGYRFLIEPGTRRIVMQRDNALEAQKSLQAAVDGDEGKAASPQDQAVASNVWARVCSRFRARKSPAHSNV